MLLELIQNADDAGARRVALLLDERHHPSASILGPALAAWAGPALLAHNDAVFTDADMRAISRIGQDAKLSSATAIGRFGLGFNSVYHVTDVPSFVSGEHLVIFDPHARCVRAAASPPLPRAATAPLLVTSTLFTILPPSATLRHPPPPRPKTGTCPTSQLRSRA